VNAIGEGIAGRRIGVRIEGLDDPIDPAVKDGVLAAVNVLAAQGAVVREVSVPLHRAQDGAYEALAIEGGRAAFDIGPYGAWHRSYYPASAIGAVNRALWGSPDLLPPRVKANHIAAEIARRRCAGTVYAKAQNVRQAFVAAYDTALREVDVLVMPTVRQTAPPQVQHARGRLDRLIAELDGKHWMRLETARNTKPFNYTGHPALAIPCRSAAGAAVSMQLVGRHFDDALLLRAAAAYERAVE
jgi:amidase